VLVYIHGGAWWKGEKPAGWGGFRAYLAAGFSVVTVEYRLTDVAPAPAAVQDVRCALSWVKANAKAYGFDAKRVVPYGTSAGGHLALMAGMLPKGNDIDLPACRDQPKTPAILDFYGPYHLRPTCRRVQEPLYRALDGRRPGRRGASAVDVARPAMSARASRRCSSSTATRTRPCRTRRRCR
jgi:acetyl esterase/lipase